jgi:hypothetical protein
MMVECFVSLHLRQRFSKIDRIWPEPAVVIRKSDELGN